VEAIVAARIKRVVVGMIDPNPLVRGKGLAALRAAGVEVRCGVLEPACLEENRAFVTYIQAARPYVTFKAAVTLDGRVAARSGDARWVTSERSRREGRLLRAMSQAIAVGVGTILSDDPQLTCRIPGKRDPIRVIVDSKLRTPPTARVVAEAARSKAPTWIITTPRAPAARARRLEDAGAQVLRVDAAAGRVAVPALLHLLAQRRVVSLLLEGGPTLAGAFWQARLIDEVAIFVAPKVLGDAAALPLLRGPAVAAMSAATPLEGLRVRRLGDDMLLTGQVFSRARPPFAEVPRCSRG
jgi:diaminohydroxyphosphoribosylaminopyrimidine deaminase/5-amino-6-(5-phosphoribosylamino)uracil reductase